MAAVTLRTLDACQLGLGPETRNAAEGALVGSTAHQRRFGAGYDQVDIIRGERTQVFRQGDRVTVAFARPRNCVLPSAASEYDDPHQAIAPSNESFAWASSTRIGYMPVKHALQ